jgi:hypothetical protein
MMPGSLFDVRHTRAQTFGHYVKHGVTPVCYYVCVIRTVWRMYDELSRHIPQAINRCRLSSGTSQHPHLSNTPIPDQA